MGRYNDGNGKIGIIYYRHLCISAYGDDILRIALL